MKYSRFVALARNISVSSSLALGCVQRPQQAGKCLLVGIRVFPLSEVTNVPCASNVLNPTGSTVHDGIINSDRVQNVGNACWLFIKRSLHFIYYPCTLDGGLREDKYQFVIAANRLIYTQSDLIPDVHILWSKPAADALPFEIGMQAFSEAAISAGIADEAGVVLDGTAFERMGIGYCGIRQASAPQKDFGNVSFRLFQRICPNVRRSYVYYRFQPFYPSQIEGTKEGFAYKSFTEISTTEISSAKVGSEKIGSSEVSIAEIGVDKAGSTEASIAEIGSSEVGTTEIDIAEARIPEIGTTEIYLKEIGTTEKCSTKVGITEVCSSEADPTEIECGEVGIAEVGIAEVNIYFWMFCSPNTPDVHSLFEPVKVFLLCHCVSLLCDAFIIEDVNMTRKGFDWSSAASKAHCSKYIGLVLSSSKLEVCLWKVQSKLSGLV